MPLEGLGASACREAGKRSGRAHAGLEHLDANHVAGEEGLAVSRRPSGRPGCASKNWRSGTSCRARICPRFTFSLLLSRRVCSRLSRALSLRFPGRSPCLPQSVVRYGPRPFWSGRLRRQGRTPVLPGRIRTWLSRRKIRAPTAPAWSRAIRRRCFRWEIDRPPAPTSRSPAFRDEPPCWIGMALSRRTAPSRETGRFPICVCIPGEIRRKGPTRSCRSRSLQRHRSVWRRPDSQPFPERQSPRRRLAAQHRRPRTRTGVVPAAIREPALRQRFARPALLPGVRDGRRGHSRRGDGPPTVEAAPAGEPLCAGLRHPPLPLAGGWIGSSLRGRRMSGSVENLLTLLSSGDAAVAEEVFRQFEPFLRRVVRRKFPPGLRARFDSEDIVQSVWGTLLPRFRQAGWRFADIDHLRGSSSRSPATVSRTASGNTTAPQSASSLLTASNRRRRLLTGNRGRVRLPRRRNCGSRSLPSVLRNTRNWCVSSATAIRWRRSPGRPAFTATAFAGCCGACRPGRVWSPIGF